MSWDRLGYGMVLQQFRPGVLEQRLLTGLVVSDALVKNQTANAGSSTVIQVILSDPGGPLEAYHKPLDGINSGQAARYGHDPFSVLLNEAAAWFIARTMGGPFQDIVPDSVIRSIWPSSSGAVAGYGALCVGVPGDTQRDEPLNDPAFCDPAAFFDALIAQQDRHKANYRWEGPQRLSLLDNGYAFAAPGYLRWASEFVAARHNAGRAALYPDEITLLRRLQSAAPIRQWLGWMLRPDQAAAFYDRIDRMLASGLLLRPLEF